MGDYEEKSSNNEDTREKQPARSRKDMANQASATRDDWASNKYAIAFESRWDNAREDASLPTAGDPFASGAAQPASVGGKTRGEGGYSERLRVASSEAAAKEGLAIAAPLAMDTATLSDAREEQANFVSQMTNQSMSFLKTRANYSINWATANQASMLRYEYEHGTAAREYVAWMPLANASDEARRELVQMAHAMGFDLADEKQCASFVMAVEDSLAMAHQLVDAKVLSGGSVAWSNRNDDPAATSRAKPELRGGELTARFQEIVAAQRAVKNAYSLVYAGLMEDRQRVAEKDSADAKQQLAVINETIEFWTEAVNGAGNIPKTTDYVSGVASSGSQALRNRDNHGERALRKARGAAAGRELDRDFTEQKHREEFHAYHEYWGPGGALPPGTADAVTAAPSEGASGGPKAPTATLGGLVKQALTLLYKDDIEKLVGKIAKADSKAGAASKAAIFTRTKHAADTYSDAKDHLRKVVEHLADNGLEQREHDYLDLGHELDRYALEHANALKSSGASQLVPKRGKEIHGTTMAVIAKIQQYRAVSSLALQSLNYNGLMRAARSQMMERAAALRPMESAGFSPDHVLRMPPRLPALSEVETRMYQQIAGTYLRVTQQDAEWNVRLARVSSQVEGLMQKLVGAGSAHAVGKRY